MITRVAIRIVGSPPRKNRRHDQGAGHPINSRDFKTLVAAIAAAWGRRPPIASGLYRVTVEATWSRKRHLASGEVVPYADVDAPISSIHDALEKAGVFDNDVRVDEIIARRYYDPERPGVVVFIEPAERYRSSP